MTNTTTPAERPRRRNWVFLMSLGLHAAFLGAAWYSGALDSVIRYDPQAEAERTEEVEERGRERAEREKEEREQRVLPEEHARKLKKETEDRHKHQLVERIREIQRNREELEAIRNRQLTQLEQRPQQALLDRLREKADAIRRSAEQIQRDRPSEHADGLADEARSVDEQADRLDTVVSPEAMEARRGFAEATQSLAANMRQASQEATSGGWQWKQLTREADQLAAEAQALAGGAVDTRGFNDTRLAEIDELPTEAELLEDLRRQAEAIHQEAGEIREAKDSDATRRVEQVTDQARRQAEQLDTQLTAQEYGQREAFAETAQGLAKKIGDAAAREPEAAPRLEALARKAEQMARDAKALADGRLTAEELARHRPAQDPSPEQLAANLRELQEETRRLADTAGPNEYEQPTGEASAALTEQLADEAQQLDTAPEAHVERLAFVQQARQTAQALAERAEQAPDDAKQGAQALAEQAHEVAEQARRFADAAAPPVPAQIDLGELAQRSAAELYDLARRLEAKAADAYHDARAAELAMRQNVTLGEAMKKLTGAQPERPNMVPQLSGDQIRTVGDLNQYRQDLGQAVQEAESMRLATESQLAQAQGVAAQAGQPGGLSQAEQRYAQQIAVNQASQMGGNQRRLDISGLMRMQFGGGSTESIVYENSNLEGSRTAEAPAATAPLPDFRIDRREVVAQALPGRKFSRDSPRQGWLYLDTWYIIGPWENHGRLDFDAHIHPPEYQIDFDAEYEGKDGQTLRWQFTQSDMIRVTPPNEQSDSTYYAFTELYFEEDTDMLLAIASDDAAKVWINDMLVWEDQGLSSWVIGEGFRKVFFKQGYNKILVRIENKPVVCQFSVLICPLEAVQK